MIYQRELSWAEKKFSVPSKEAHQLDLKISRCQHQDALTPQAQDMAHQLHQVVLQMVPLTDLFPD